MKRILSVLIGVSFLSALGSAKDTSPGGIVYGPKAAFKIDAPKGWVLDNNAGADQGLPCVLYPKGSTWADAKTIMYAKTASTQYLIPNTSGLLTCSYLMPSLTSSSRPEMKRATTSTPEH